MGRPKLPEEVVAKRLVRLRNLERMYAASRKREAAKDIRIAELEVTVADQQRRLDTQAVQIAELQTMVFGKRRQPPTGTPPASRDMSLAPKPPRTKDSYRRHLPPASAITATKEYPVVCLRW